MNIKSTLASFIAIVIFVSLSISIFVSASWTGSSVINNIDSLIKQTNMHDVELIFPYGFDNEEFKQIKNIDGVDEIEGNDVCFQTILLGEGDKQEKYQAIVYSVSDNISKLSLTEGKLPNSKGELVMDDVFASKHNLKVGDVIRFEHDNNGSLRTINKLYNFDLDNNNIQDLNLIDDEDMLILVTDTYTITGLANSISYIAKDDSSYGVSPINLFPNSLFVYISDDSFDLNAGTGFSEILIRNNDFSNKSYFDKEYKESLNDFVSTLKNKVDEIALRKSDKLKNKLETIKNTEENKLETALNEINKAEEEIKKSKRELADAKIKLDNALKELNGNEEEYDDGLEEYDDSYKQYISEYDQYNSFKNIVFVEGEFNPGNIIANKDSVTTYLSKQADALLKQGKTEECITINSLIELISTPGWNLAEPNLSIAKDCFTSICNAFDQTFNSLKGQLDKIKNKLNDSRYLLDVGWNEYNDGLNKYNDNLRKVKNAENDLEKAKEDYQKGVESLEEFKDKIKDIPDFKVAVTSRTTNVGFIIVSTLVNVFTKAKYSMSAFFLIIAMLICYSSISRTVHDQVVLIGVKKALSLSRAQITMSYLMYTCFALLFGCAIGLGLARFIISGLLLQTVSSSFVFPYHLVVDLKPAALLCLLEAVLLLTTTYIACRRILAKDAIVLIQGDSPSYGKVRFYEKFRLWNRLSLISKTIINNCINEPRRVIGTIISIVGTTALIVIALTMNRNVTKSFDIQYTDYFHFKYRIDYSSIDAQNTIRKLLDDKKIDYSNIFYTKLLTKMDDGSSIYTHTNVFDDVNEYSKMVTLDITKGNSDDIYKGLWLSDAYLNYYNDPNRQISLSNYSGDEINMKPNGYFKYHLSSYYAIMDANTYRKYYGDYENNSFLINIDDNMANELLPSLRKIEGFVSLNNYYEQSKTSLDALTKVTSAFAIIYIVFSIIMAFLVLANLLTMLVNEKKTELIVLMINGYYLEEVKRYIYSDTIFLTIVGIIFGVVAGSIMGDYVVRSFESESVLFIHRVDILSCVVGATVTAILTYVLARRVFKSIEKFKVMDLYTR